MKRHIMISLFIALAISAYSQAPGAFSYQAVLRNSDGSLIENEDVTIQVVIRQETADGFSVYLENHDAQTNEFGIVNLKIGQGTTSDDFSLIDWSEGIYFLEVTVDGVKMGTTQLLSVPFALYAEESGGGFSGSYLDLTDKIWEINESGIIYDKGKVLIDNPVGDIQMEIPDRFGAGGRNLLIGDDAYLTDVDIPNTLGIYSHSDSLIGSLKLGANGPVISGSNQNLGIGTTDPDARLEVVGGMKVGSDGIRFTEIIEVGGTTESSGITTAIPLPSGWTGENTRVVSCEIRNSVSSYWIGSGASTGSSVFSYELYPLEIQINHGNDGPYSSTPYRILLMKIE